MFASFRTNSDGDGYGASVAVMPAMVCTTGPVSFQSSSAFAASKAAEFSPTRPTSVACE